MKESFWKSKNMVAKEKSSEEELADTKPKKKKCARRVNTLLFNYE